MKINFNINNSGQTMILSVLVLSGLISVVAALSSFLLSVQIRSVTDARASGEAIFAADTGIECILFKEFGRSLYSSVDCPNIGEEKILFNGAEPRARFTFNIVSQVGENKTYLSVGKDKYGRTARALQISFTKK